MSKQQPVSVSWRVLCAAADDLYRCYTSPDRPSGFYEIVKANQDTLSKYTTEVLVAADRFLRRMGVVVGT